MIATKIHSLWLNQASMAKMKGSIRKPVKNTSRISIFTIYMVGSFVSGCLSSKQFTHFVVQISQRLFFLLECAWCSFCDLILHPQNPPFVCKSVFFNRNAVLVHIFICANIAVTGQIRIQGSLELPKGRLELRFTLWQQGILICPEEKQGKIPIPYYPREKQNFVLP